MIPLVDEGRDYAARLRAVGVAVDLQIYPGMIHEFLRMGNVVTEALQARAAIGQALATAFRTAHSSEPPVGVESSRD